MGRKDKHFASTATKPVTVGAQVRGIEEVVNMADGVIQESATVVEPVTVEPQGEKLAKKVVEKVVEQSAALTETVEAIDVISNPGKNVRRIGGIVLAPGGVYTLTERDMDDTKTMAKVKHMISLGVLHRGSGR